MQAGEVPMSQYPPHHEATLEHRESDEYSPPTNVDMNRKRTYSSVSNDFNNAYAARPPPGWPAHDSPRHTTHNSAVFSPSQAPGTQQYRDPDYSPNLLQQAAVWKSPPEPLLRRQSSSFDSAVPVDQNHIELPMTWDNDIFEKYDAVFTYAILPALRADSLHSIIYTYAFVAINV